MRRAVQATAQRLEDELGEERPCFLDTCQADREELPRPDLPLVVGLEGGYVHWFHITMQITVMTTMARSLQPPPPGPDRELTAEEATKLITQVRADLTRLKWFLWHGTIFRALNTVEGITIDLETLNPKGEPSKLLRAVREFDSYLRANAGRIPNYGERRRASEAISTAFVESTVNQVISKRMVNKQQMRWTPRGAHLLLQIRTQVLNDQLADEIHR